MIHAAETTPRARRREDQERRILETAMGMVEKDGLEGLSVNKLAAALDFTPGALYRYFPSKDALLSLLVQRVLEDVSRHLEEAQALVEEDASPLVKVVALVHGYRNFARRAPERFGLLAATLADPKVLLSDDGDAQPVVVLMTAALQRLALALLEAQHAGLLEEGDMAERTLCIFALTQGIQQMQKQARHAPDILDTQRLVVNGVRALLLGWGATARNVDAAILRAQDVATTLQAGRMRPKTGAKRP